MIDEFHEKKYTCRQLDLIEEMIAAYRENKLSFYNLVAILDDLIIALAEYEEDALEKLRGEWWELEQINAAVLDNRMSEKDFMTDQTDIIDSLQAILEIVKETKDRWEKNSPELP